MQFCTIFVLIVAVACAQLMPGSHTSYIANGKGGLGRYLRNLEGMSGKSYYPNGNPFEYSPCLFSICG